MDKIVNILNQSFIFGTYKVKGVNNMEEVFFKYGPDIKKWCFSKTKNMLDAEDLFQEIQMQLFKASLKDPIILDEERFVWKIAYYTWCKKVRDYEKQKHFVSLSLEMSSTIEDSSMDILKEVEKNELSFVLQNFIEGLSEKLKQCIILYYYKDLSVKEISEMLHLKEGMVKYYLFQGRKKLRSDLENEKL